MTEFIECPRHEGSFDCSPFCDMCEGNQEFEKTDTLPCYYCHKQIDYEIWLEELEMCVDCSHKYYNGEME